MGTVCLIGCEQSLSCDDLGLRTRPTEPAAKERPPPRSITLAARSPAGEGVGAPISNAAVRTIGAVKGVTGISIGSDDATARAAGRVGSAGGTGAGLANPLVTHGRPLVGAGGRGHPVGRGQRDRHHHDEENELVHRALSPTRCRADRQGDVIRLGPKRKSSRRGIAQHEHDAWLRVVLDCYSTVMAAMAWAPPAVADAARRICAVSPRRLPRDSLRYARRGKDTPAGDGPVGRDGMARQAARSPAASSSLIFSSSRSVTIFRSWRFSICNSATMSARPRLAPFAASKPVDGAGAPR